MWKRDNSEQLNAPAPQPELEAGMVYLDDNFNALRFDAWEPQDLMSTIHPLLDTARAEGQHIWDSTEHHQAYALGCWTAAARRTIAEALLVGVEESVHYKGSYPVQIADLSRSFFLDAEKWRTFAVEVAGDPDYRVSGTEDLTPQAAWPLPPATRVSPLLMDGLQHALGLGNAESKLLTELYPHVEQEANGPHLKRFFGSYKENVNREQAALQSRLEFIAQRWREGFDPNAEPGHSLYMDMVRCVEAYVALGAHMLMPATLDPRMRVAARTAAPKAETTDLPAFSPGDLRGGGPATPQLGTFDPTVFTSSAVVSQPESATPQLPAFDPSQIVGDKALTEAQEQSAQLPTFDPSHLFGASAVSGAGIVIEEQPPATLSPFDPNSLKG